MKSTTTLILASKSPRRIELMTLAGFDFLSVPAVKEEKITGGTSPSDAVLMLSRQKAEEIAEKFPYNTVIGADTVVALGNEIMGKPENEQDAFNMLKKLSGKTHTVLTGVCVISPDKQINFYEKTEVEFYPLGDDEIRQYIASGEPMDSLLLRAIPLPIILHSDYRNLTNCGRAIRFAAFFFSVFMTLVGFAVFIN